MPPPLWKDNQLAVVGGELPRGNQIWLDGKDACWDSGPCMLWGTLALSLGDKGVQYLLAHCPWVVKQGGICPTEQMSGLVGPRG